MWRKCFILRIGIIVFLRNLYLNDYLCIWFRICVFSFECCRTDENVWVIHDPQFTMGHSYMWPRQSGGLDKSCCKVCLPWERWLSISSYKCQVEDPRRTSWCASCAAMWYWFHDDQISHPVNMPVIQVMVNAVVWWAPFVWAPTQPYCCKERGHRSGSLMEFSLSASPSGSYKC